MRDDIVPFPDPGAPITTARKRRTLFIVKLRQFLSRYGTSPCSIGLCRLLHVGGSFGWTYNARQHRMSLLEYESQILADIYAEDGLLLTAKGLGAEKILLKLLEIFCDPGVLVLVVNATPEEEDYFIQELEMTKAALQGLPTVVNNEYSSKERESLYLSGGVLFITSRILVVDMLRNQIPTHLIHGIIVNHAHKVTDESTEAFILRLYREKNKTGFIKAFSDSAQAFTSGFFQIERTMKNLFVRKLYLWPRFQALVSSSLEKHKPEAIELHQKMTPNMMAVQQAILDVMSICLQELKKSNRTLDGDQLTIENGIGKAFDRIIRLQLDPIWHQLSFKSRQLVADLKTLRQLLLFLTQYDCVTFYSHLEFLRSSETSSGWKTSWMLLDAAQPVFACAKTRVFGPSANKGEPKAKKGKPSEGESSFPEANPKWQLLADVLAEIEKENAKRNPSERPSVLVVADDDYACKQLREYLTLGSKKFLETMFDKLVGTSPTASKSDQSKQKQTKRQSKKGKEKATNEDKKDVGEIYGQSAVILLPLHNPFLLVRALNEHAPQYVVLYNPDMEFVRQLEVYKAGRPGAPLRVYFLLYEMSVEEQKYLTALRKESEAFEQLIKDKSRMVVPEDQDGKTGLATNLVRDMSSAALVGSSTRKGGSQSAANVESTVIVDMREFRSALPSIIYRRGMNVEPITLEVGDYILTPEMCVERKSVSDLISSLASGRLYNQVVSMTRYYKRAVLLIEFDAARSFSLQSRSSIGSEISSISLTSKLVLLTLHFPTLKILWCQSPHATAELFEVLKEKQAQPDASLAASVGASDGSSVQSETKTYNPGPVDLLLKLPGINFKNYRYVMNRVSNVAELSQMSLKQLAQVLDNESNAKQLWHFFNDKPSRK
ncbi:DNA repair endonuclease XPF-like isoform X2 [Oscarella lobularis]|uniref:DNA repair endonuclease XPF-like isoform X2 n=1 Tax=Oscarella lobularis TaxID=121494 RepID=UPI003313C9C2